jgi:geranylgeranyl reductase family protein
VLLLEKAEFPRDKPCGGGVNVRAARLLPFDLTPVVERTINGMDITVHQQPGWRQSWHEPLSYLTQRSRLDAFLLEQARAAGVTVRERMPLREVERENGRIVVRAGTEAFESRTLVAADGANGPAMKLAGAPVERRKGIALEGNITPRRFPSEWQDVFLIELGSVPGGYGWLFPKGDHVNVGVGGPGDLGPSLRTRLDGLTRFYGLDPDEMWGLRGHPLPVRYAHSRVADGNVLAVGDAAGLVDPLTGEGIFSAIWSGTMAARHLAEYVDGRVPSLDAYRTEMERTLLAELNASQIFCALFHLRPSLWSKVVHRWPRAWRAVCGLIRGDQTYLGIMKAAGPVAYGIDLTARAVRGLSHHGAAGRLGFFS